MSQSSIDPAIAPLRGSGRHPALAVVVRLVREKPLATFGGVVLLVFILAAILADVITPYPATEIHQSAALHPPSAEYWFGTDNLGRDIFSRVLYGARISLAVGFGVICLSITGATILGTISAYAGGRFDLLVQRLVDAVTTLPLLLLAITIMTVLGHSLVNVVLALAFRLVLSESRTVRSTVLAIKGQQYVEAARALGAGPLRLLLLHVLPNIFAPIIIVASLGLSAAILAESSLSFLGFGVPPPTPTWGGMLSGDGRQYLTKAPWIAIFPGTALSLVVFGINVLGDGLRDVLDPRLRGSK
jgi:peptide/nickel transport system permease protein